MPHATQSSAAEVAIRPATFADVDNVVEVFIATSSLDEIARYRNQYIQQYPEDLIKYETLVHQLLTSPKYSDYHVMVAEAPSLEDATVTKVVAYAVWDVSYRNKRQYGSEYKSQNGKARQNPSLLPCHLNSSEGRSAILMPSFSQRRCNGPVRRSVSL